MATVALFKTQALYNQWMNHHFYSLCDSIPERERKRDVGAFFKSIHGTLNHLLLGDRLWLSRFQNTPYEIQSLGQELYEDYRELKQQRTLTDQHIINYIEGLDDSSLESPISYTSKADGLQRRFILHDCLLHFFHHQTHHRGQVSTLISQLGIDIGDTDLLYMPGMA